MEERSRLYQNLFLILTFGIGLIALYAGQAEEAPRAILFFGRFHPVLLHLPIGALILTFFLDVIARFQKNYPVELIRVMLGFIAFFAIITCFLGYFLSLEGGYTGEALDLHLYTGVTTAVLTTLLFFMSLKKVYEKKRSFFVLFILSIINISIAGHFGSVLTHGDTFLTEYALTAEKEETIEVIDSLKLYEHVVAKILDQKCVQCHNNSKKKGNLTLLSKASILKGGENGATVVKGNAAASSLYTRLLLPISDEEHMPPEGKEQLTKSEIWLIRHWIEKGADFKNHVNLSEDNDSLVRLLSDYLVVDEVKIKRAPAHAIAAVRNMGFRVEEIVPGKGALNVKYIGKEPTKSAIDVLSEIKEQVVELNFGDALVNDEMTSILSQLDNLQSLRINSTNISDAFIKNIKSLTRLEVLNIYRTAISDQGIRELLKSIRPKKIYTWQSKVSQETANELANEFKVNIQNNIHEGFVENSRLEKPNIVPTNTIFLDSIHVAVESRLKGVDLRYTLDGKDPDTSSEQYTTSFTLEESQTLKVAAFKKGWEPSEILTRSYSKVKYEIVNFNLKIPPNESYAVGKKLFDLKEGSTAFGDGEWLGYFGPDLIVTVDLGEEKTVDKISFNCLEDVRSWILYPKRVQIYVSPNATNFKKIEEVEIERKGEGGDPEIKKVTIDLAQQKGRYFKIEITNYQVLPEWHSSAGNPSWLFVDEIYFW